MSSPVSATGTPQRTRYEFYDNNRLKQITGPSGAITTALYEERGLPAKVTDPEISAGNNRTLSYTYNKAGQVKAVRESAHDHPTTYGYNAFGDRISLTTPKGHAGGYSTTYTPDKLGRTTIVTQPAARAAGDAGAEAWQKLPTTVEYEFDPVGNLEWIRQPKGESGHTQVNYTYWPNNLLKTETDPFDDPAAPHHVVAYDYDKEGRQILRQDKFDNVEQRRTESVYKPDGTTRFQTSTGTGLPTHRSFFDYDAANNLTLVKTADNYNGVPESPVDPNVSQIVNAYTTQGQLEKVEETIYPPAGGTPVAKTSLFEWERDGVIGRHTVDGQASEFDHRLDRMETRFDPFNGAEDFTASWSDSGDLNQLTLPNGAKIDQAYDGAARLIDRTVKVGTTTMSGWTDISYDDNDNRLGEQVSQRKLDGSGVRSGTSGYGYDQLDRLIRNRHGFDQGTAAVALQAGQRRQRPGRVGGVGQRLGDPGLCRHQLRLHQQPPGF